MYQVSQDVLDIINSDSRTFGALIEVGGESIDTGFKSIIIQYTACDNTERVNIGSACATQLTMNINYDEKLPKAGEEFKLSLTLGDAVIPMGVFLPQKPTTSGGLTTMIAYDRMQSATMTAYYDSLLSYPCDISDVCTEIEQITGYRFKDKPSGLTLDRRIYGDDGTTVSYVAPFDDYTIQQTIGMIAGLYGKFATFDRNGDIDFRWYEPIDYIIPTNRLMSDATVSEDEFVVQYISCDRDATTKIVAGDENGTMGIGFSNYIVDQQRLDDMFNAIGGMSYHATDAQILGNPLLDLGDVIKVDTVSGVTYDVPIMAITQEYDGGVTSTIKSYGSTIQSNSNYVSPTQRAINQVRQEMAVLNQLIINKTITIGDIEGLELGFTNLLNQSRTMADYIVYAELCTKNNVPLCTKGGIQLIA